MLTPNPERLIMHLNGRFPRFFAVWGLLGLMLAGCATADPAISRYVLPTSSAAPAEPASDAPVLRLAPVRVSGLVDRRGLLLQTSDIRIHAASAHQWADDLAPQLQRSLLHQLAAQLPGWQLQPAALASQGASLTVWVDQFQGRYDGQALVSGRWQLQDEYRNTLQTKEFFITQSLQDDGYSALVHSLAQAWQALATQIAQQLQRAAE